MSPERFLYLIQTLSKHNIDKLALVNHSIREKTQASMKELIFGDPTIDNINKFLNLYKGPQLKKLVITGN